MVLRALKFGAIASVGFWLLFMLFVLIVTGGHGDPTDVHTPSHSVSLIGILSILMSLSISVLLFTVVGLVSVGILKTFQFVKRTLGFA